MKYPLLAALVCAAAPAFAQKVPETDASRQAVKALKGFTDQLRIDAPPPLYDGGKPGYENAMTFKVDFFKTYWKYRDLWTWTADNGPDEGLSAEKFQVALAKASNNGKDMKAGMIWTCELTQAARGYFHYYNAAAGRDDARMQIFGTPVAAVEFIDAVVDAIAARYKEATQLDIARALRYHGLSECEAAGEVAVEEFKKENPETTQIPPASLVEVHKDPKPWETPDFGKYNYFVFYYDASWQSWDQIAKDKHWKQSDLETFVLRRAPEWVGSFVARAPKADKEAFARTYKSGAPGEVLRHPLQPKSAKDRDQKLIAEHKKKYKLKW